MTDELYQIAPFRRPLALDTTSGHDILERLLDQHRTVITTVRDDLPLLTTRVLEGVVRIDIDLRERNELRTDLMERKLERRIRWILEALEVVADELLQLRVPEDLPM